MVCFRIVFAQPVIKIERQKIVQDVRFQHLCKLYNAEQIGRFTMDGMEYLEVAVCDLESIALLRDVPEPLTCFSVKLYRNDTFLYKHYKMMKEECIPPRDPFLKRVYWTASQLESRLKPYSNPKNERPILLVANIPHPEAI